MLVSVVELFHIAVALLLYVGRLLLLGVWTELHVGVTSPE